MPGSPAVSKAPLTLRRRIELSMASVPVRLLLTKKMAPPPSLAWFSSMTLPAIRNVIWLPSRAMAPPLPPPGVPGCAGLAPWPVAWLWVKTLLSTVHETPMLLSAPPLEQALPSPGAPPKVELTTNTGSPPDWLRARMAPPPTSGPVSSQRLRWKYELTTLSRPPRTKMAPPPPPSAVSPVALPSTNVRFCTVRRGWSWSWQCDVVHFWAASHVFM
jgi:hypothetical protein